MDIKQNESPGWVARLVGASSRASQVAGLIPVQGM